MATEPTCVARTTISDQHSTNTRAHGMPQTKPNTNVLVEVAAADHEHEPLVKRSAAFRHRGRDPTRLDNLRVQEQKVLGELRLPVFHQRVDNLRRGAFGVGHHHLAQATFQPLQWTAGAEAWAVRGRAWQSVERPAGAYNNVPFSSPLPPQNQPAKTHARAHMHTPQTARRRSRRRRARQHMPKMRDPPSRRWRRAPSQSCRGSPSWARPKQDRTPN